jgi:hypothetical protein
LQSLVEGGLDVASESPITRDQIKAMAEIVHLELPEDRLDSLVKMYIHFDEGFVKIREIETGSREPTTLLPKMEVN